jgi:hypothetical protein
MKSVIQILNSIRPLDRQNKIHVLRGLISRFGAGSCWRS